MDNVAFEAMIVLGNAYLLNKNRKDDKITK